MSRMGQPAADDVILDLLVDGVEPTHENLMVAITAYPQHRDALVAFFANLAVQTALNDEATPSGRGVEQFANIGVSRVLAHRHDAPRQASTSGIEAWCDIRAAPATHRVTDRHGDDGYYRDACHAEVTNDAGHDGMPDLGEPGEP